MTGERTGAHTRALSASADRGAALRAATGSGGMVSMTDDRTKPDIDAPQGPAPSELVVRDLIVGEGAIHGAVGDAVAVRRLPLPASRVPNGEDRRE